MAESFTLEEQFTDTQLAEAAAMRRFVLAGNSIFTLVSEKTGKRCTFRVNRKDKDNASFLFVSLLTGPDNTEDYSYLGILTLVQNAYRFQLTAKSCAGFDSEGYRAFSYMQGYILGDDRKEPTLPPNLSFYHIGRCARCSRPLTDPESIERGLGPECAGKE